jgi:hypothetical protein
MVAALASMAPGATVTYTCSLSNVKASFVNVAFVHGKLPTGSKVVNADDSWVNAAPEAPPAPVGVSLNLNVRDPYVTGRVVVTASGKSSVCPSSACQTLFPPGTSVTLTPRPSQWFKGWEGPPSCNGKTTPCNLIFGGDSLSITASFKSKADAKAKNP